MIFTNFFIDCEYIETYTVINEIIVFEMCKQLQIEPYFLSKSKPLRNYDKQLFKKLITHCLLSILNIYNHKKNSCPIFIVKIRQYNLILEKS